MTFKPLTEHHLEFLRLKGGCRGSAESTLAKLPQCLNSRVTAHLGQSIDVKIVIAWFVRLYVDIIHELERVII